MNKISQFVSIDVCKKQLDIALRAQGLQWSVDYTEQGLETLCSTLSEFDQELFVVEAKGGLKLLLVCVLAEEHLPVVVINPRQVRDFAKATGQLAKTDALDATVLVRFANAVRSELRLLKTAEELALMSLLTRRRQLTDMLVAEKIAMGARRVLSKKRFSIILIG